MINLTVSCLVDLGFIDNFKTVSLIMAFQFTAGGIVQHLSCILVSVTVSMRESAGTDKPRMVTTP